MSYYICKHCGIIKEKQREIISVRYKTITKAINREFWGIIDDTKNSLYVGSYGRNTAINSSDLDILAILPNNEFDRFNNLQGNSQSRLLQSVRKAIITSYPRSDIRADGQVVKIKFSDGIKFEVVPSFKKLDWFGNWDGKYKYPDSNMGGNWKSSNPKAEQEAIKNKNKISNGLLVDTCRHLRIVRDNFFKSYNLSGIVIDSFVYYAIDNWRWSNVGDQSTYIKGTYELKLLNYFNNNLIYSSFLKAPGSEDIVAIENSKEGLLKVLEYCIKK